MEKECLILLGVLALVFLAGCAETKEQITLTDDEGNVLGEAIRVSSRQYRINPQVIIDRTRIAATGFEARCIDSDGADNGTIGGTVTRGGSTLSDFCEYNARLGRRTLNETVCGSWPRANLQIDCARYYSPNGGNQTCIDPDGAGPIPAYCG